MQKAMRKKDYLRKLLDTYKSWGGPSLTSEKLIAESNAKTRQTRTTCQDRIDIILDRIARPDSFKLNKISYEKRLGNLF